MFLTSHIYISDVKNRQDREGVLAVNAVGLAYVGLFAVSGAVCLAAIPRARTLDHREIRRGLAGLLATTGIWALLKTAFFVIPDPFREAAYTLGLISGFATIWAWLYFCSAYTGRTYHKNSALRKLSAGVFITVVSIKLTNPLHQLYFTTTEVTTPFVYLAIEHGIVHWIATGLSYVLAVTGIFMLFELYLDSGYDTRPLAVLTALLGLPVVLDIAALLLPQFIAIIYAPLGVAAFGVGALFVFEERLLAVQNTTRTGEKSIYFDDNGYIRDYSPAAAADFPALDGSVGERLDTVLPDVAAVAESDEQIIEHEEAGQQRYYLLSISTMALSDTRIRILALSDVTETERQRRQLVERERELNERNELYRAVIAASFAFVFRTEVDGELTYVSPSVEHFLGYTAEELEGRSITETTPDEETAELARQRLELVSDGETSQLREFPLEAKAGQVVHGDIRTVPIYDADVPPEERTPDDIVGIQGMVRDASERRQLEGLISVINRVLRHNVRNEMTIISGYAEMLKNDLDGDAASKAGLIEETADRLLGLSESAQLIEENRTISPELGAIDIVPIVDHTVTQLEIRYPNAPVTLDTPETAIAETRSRVETGLWEIVENAAKHGGDPASVDIDVTITDTQVVMTVSDDGPGLPETEREVLESGKETPLVHGQGLGLWLAYWLVTNLDGQIEVTEYQQGTTIEIRLPRPS